MKGGFSFCGVDIADIGLEYAPENKDTYVYRPGASNVHEETFEGHDGGYVYGSSKEPKEFILRCFYEEDHVSGGVIAKANALFKVGKSGMLIFQRRPWCYYYATVTAVDDSEMYNYMNGLFVVTMKAYYPYARGIENDGKLLYNLLDDPYHNEIMQNTGLLDRNIAPKTTHGTAQNPISTSNHSDIILYNPGTERAKVSIKFKGVAGDGFSIYNKTTDQLCRYVAFNVSGTGNYIYTDGISGKTILHKNNEDKLAFLYHDFGFIELEPSFPIMRRVYASCTNNDVTTRNRLCDSIDDPRSEWYAGKYIYLNNEWVKIAHCSGIHHLTLTKVVEADMQETCIVLMNEIVLTPTQDTSIPQLEFIYKPTFA